MHAQHAQQLRMVARQRAQAAQGQHGGNAAGLHELAELVHRIGDADAAAAVDHRPFGAGDGGDRGGQGSRRRCVDALDRGRHVGGKMRGGTDLHVLGQVDQHRPGPAFAGQAEGFAQHLRQVLDLAHQEAVLDDRHGHAEHVQFLERVGAQQRRADLAGDAHHRHRVEQAVGDPGHQVGRTRAGGGHAYPDPAAGAGVAVGGQRRALFVADQDVAQPRIHQRVVERHDRAARIAEDRVHAFGFQRMRDPGRAIAQSGRSGGGGGVHAAAVPCLPASLLPACGALACSHTILARSSWPTFSIGWSLSACWNLR